MRANKEAVRAANPVERVAERYVKLRRNGHSTLVGLCPIHKERTPSFTIYKKTQSWFCYGCGRGGDVFNLVMAIENLPFRDALEELAFASDQEWP